MALLNALAMASTTGQLIVALAPYLVAGDSVLLLSPTMVMTKTAIIQNDTLKQLTIIMLGLDAGFSQAANCLLSWQNTSGQSTAYNSYAQGAVTVNSNVSIIPAGGYTSCRLIGHSYGGAMAMQLTNLLAPILSSGGTFEVYTYGAPKPDRFAAGWDGGGFAVRRCFQNNDPVPSLPLGPNEVGSLWVYVGVPTARAWSRWSQGITGLVFDGTGGIVQSTNPTVSATPTLTYLSLLSWITGINCFAAVSHSLASYTQAASIVVNAPVFTQQPETGRVRRQPDPTVAQITRQRDEELAVVAINVSANPRDTAVGIQSGIVQVPGVRYRGVRVGGVPWVYYGDTPVVPTRTVRSRRALVRYLNRSL